MRKDKSMPYTDIKNMRTVSASGITTASPDYSAIAMDFSPSNSWTSNLTLRITSQTAEVAKVIYNDPATIVLWRDGTKTVVKCHPDDVFDPEKGFLLCCAKKLLGGGKYNDVMRKHVPEGGGVRIGAATITAGKIDIRKLMPLLKEARK